MRSLDVRSNVRVVLEDYLYSLDAQDFDLLANCFTDDAEISYDLKPHTFVGGRALAEWVADTHARSRAMTLHTLGNVHITVDARTVSAVSHVVAHLAKGVAEGYTVKSRGIRYDDELVETAEGWRICRRTHRPIWQCEGTGQPLGDIDTDLP